MAELKDFLKEIDLPEDLAGKDVPEIKEAFFKSFVNRTIAPTDEEIVTKVSGKMLSRIEGQLIKALEIPADQVKGKKIEEVIEYAAKTTKDRFAELTESAGKGNDEKVTKALSDLEKERKEKDQYKSKAAEVQKALEDKEAEWTGKFKTVKRNTELSGIKAKIPLIDDVKEIQRKGFEAILAEKYDFDYDDKEVLVAKDKQGNLVPNAKGTGFMSPEDVLKKEAQDAGILKMNSVVPPKKTTTPDGKPIQPIPGRKLPESAIRNANRA